MSSVEPARVYALSGAGAPSDSASANTSSLPDILRRHGRSNKRTKRKATSKSSASINAQLDRIELIQDFEFPEASNKIKSTRDGSSLVATGTYKPHIRVWELDQLSLKFERHTNSENIDFVLLSDDWTKQLHLQTDRTLELHAQGGHHARVRIPRFGRALAYHFASAEALVGAAGSEVYRLNLDYGRFMAPYQLGQGIGQGEVTGCNAVDVNPAHGLLAFGTEGAGVVELWDQRARRRAGALSITTPTVMDAALSSARRGLPGLILPGEDANETAVTNAMSGLSVSALSSAQDGLNLAVGTSTGHVLLYDLRMDRPYTTKDQGFSLPIKSLSWPGDAPPSTNFSSSTQTHRATSSEARDTVLSADAKGIKIWSKSEPSSNLVSISPQSGCDLNDVHHLPGSGLLFAAVEGTQCAAWYVPTLGPAPKWCSFLDRVTDEIDEEQMSGGKRGVYEDFKFLDRPELERLNMSHLIGSNVLRPYMHGYFVALPLYERARLLANPTSFEDAREKAIKAKLEQKAESRIRSSGARKALDGFNAKVQVNKDLAEKAARELEREEQRQLALATAAAAEGEGGTAGTSEAPRTKKPSKASLLGDERFKELFTNPEFQVDQTSREYALLNPSSAAVTSAARGTASGSGGSKRRTAVEEEEAESDRESLDPDQEEDRDRARRRSQQVEDEAGSDSDSDEGDLAQYDPRNHAPGTKRYQLEKAAKLQAQARKKGRGARLVEGEDDDDDDEEANIGGRARKGQSTFEGRIKAANQANRRSQSGLSSTKASSKKRSDLTIDQGEDVGGAHSFTFIPSSTAPDTDLPAAEKQGQAQAHDYTHQDAKRAQRQRLQREFGAGLTKASDHSLLEMDDLEEDVKSGRKKRREVGRSASKNVMRR